ncbi:MAG TPA: D-alanine--D-alanine ligase family protein [Candidatus Saccharimonadales bacterium]|nr:D-alanine--D-alanine ligase family protein [Candidatus Saccharimonadales bacterium]
MKNVKRIGVFFGGKSPEHDISIITGQLIISVLKKIPEYEVVPVYLDKQEHFFIDEKLGSLAFFSVDNYQIELEKTGGYDLDLDASNDCLVFKKGGAFSRKKIKIDFVFPAFHGNLGEDGAMQGLFNIFNVPYVGCDVAASSIAMNKILTKIFYQGLNVPTTKFVFYNRAQWQADKTKILEEVKTALTWPVFVKPPHLGSSIGITKVSDFKDLEQACEVALHYDDQLLVEEGVENLMDVTCAVRGYKNPEPSLLQESTFSTGLFSYEDKYLSDGGAQLGQAEKKIIIPASLDENTTKKIQEASVKVFQALAGVGIARFDFLYNKATGQYFANEINPLPGTLYHHLWEKSGVKIGELVRQLINDALLRQEEKDASVHSFSSEVLSQLKSLKLAQK